MIATAAETLGLRAVGRFLALRATSRPSRATRAWWRYGWRAGLAVHFCLTLFYFAKACGMPVDGAPAVISTPVKFLAEFHSANGYFLYANFESRHYQVDFEGSNDGGKTWRTYEFRHVPRRSIGSTGFFRAPVCPVGDDDRDRSSRASKTSTVPLVAAHLLARNPEVTSRFAATRSRPTADGPSGCGAIDSRSPIPKPIAGPGFTGTRNSPATICRRCCDGAGRHRHSVWGPPTPR